MNLENITLTEMLFIGAAAGAGAGKLLVYTAEKANDLFHKNKTIFVGNPPSIMKKIADPIPLLPRKTK